VCGTVAFLGGRKNALVLKTNHAQALKLVPQMRLMGIIAIDLYSQQPMREYHTPLLANDFQCQVLA